MQVAGRVACRLCGKRFLALGRHLRTHGVPVQDYRSMYPGSPICSESVSRARSKGSSSRALHLSYEGLDPDSRLNEFMAGSMLGDGHIERIKKNGRYREGGANKAYLAWKSGFLGSYFPTRFHERLSSPHVRSGKRYLGWWVSTTTHPFLTSLHGLWYENRKKVVPEEYLSQFLTSFALAVWVSDDGHVCHGSEKGQGRQALLYTHSFTKREVEFLQSLLKEKFGLSAGILMARNVPSQFMLTFNSVETWDLILACGDNCPDGMDYKLAMPDGAARRRLEHRSKLSPEQVREVRKTPLSEVSSAEFAKRFGMSAQALRSARAGKTYKWVEA